MSVNKWMRSAHGHHATLAHTPLCLCHTCPHLPHLPHLPTLAYTCHTCPNLPTLLFILLFYLYFYCRVHAEYMWTTHMRTFTFLAEYILPGTAMKFLAMPFSRLAFEAANEIRPHFLPRAGKMGMIAAKIEK